MSTYHLNLLTLLELSQVGRRTVQQLLLRPGRDELREDQLQPGSDILHALFHPVSREELDQARSRAEAVLEHSQETGVQLEAYGDPGYPARLAVLSDFPVLLFLRGNPLVLHHTKTISITGSRNTGEKVLKITESYAHKLADLGWHLVHGHSEGCEAAAHRGSLQASRPGTAVLGSGLDPVHPRKNARLAQEILEAGGCLLSEHPNGTRARPRQIIERERIRTALSAGVILIQESFSGHAMHTIRFASSQRKPLAALDPGHKFMTGDATGNRFLIKARAATPLRTTADLDRFIDFLNHHLASEVEGTSYPRKEPQPVQLRMWED